MKKTQYSGKQLDQVGNSVHVLEHVHRYSTIKMVDSSQNCTVPRASGVAKIASSTQRTWLGQMHVLIKIYTVPPSKASSNYKSEAELTIKVTKLLQDFLHPAHATFSLTPHQMSEHQGPTAKQSSQHLWPQKCHSCRSHRFACC